MKSHIVSVLLIICITLTFGTRVVAQEIAKSAPSMPQEPNTNFTYRALRNPGFGKIVPVQELVLKRDAGTFTLTGALTFLAPVNGKVTGAVFFRQGAL